MCVNLELILRQVVHISISPLSTLLHPLTGYSILQKDICIICTN